MSYASNPAPRRGHAGLVVLVVVLALVCALGGYVLALVTSGRAVLISANQLAEAGEDMRQMIDAGSIDLPRARADAQAMTDAAADMHSRTDGLVWRVAELIPVYGQDAAAVRTLTRVSDDLAQGALAPVVAALPGDDFESLGLADKAKQASSSLAALSDALPQVTAVVNKASAEVDGIGTLHLDVLNNVVTQVREPLGEASRTLSDVNGARSALAGMLGLE